MAAEKLQRILWLVTLALAEAATRLAATTMNCLRNFEEVADARNSTG